MQKDVIIEVLKEKGYRITKQRLMLLDVILEEECASCKEIFYKASQKDSNIGAATVYRMINTLEEIGAIDRKNMYKINYTNSLENTCLIEFEDKSIIELSSIKWNQIIQTGLMACGLSNGQQIRNIMAK